MATMEAPPKPDLAQRREAAKRRKERTKELQQKVATCGMAVALGLMLCGFLGPFLPPWNLPGNWCLWIAAAGYTFAAGLLVYLWKTW